MLVWAGDGSLARLLILAWTTVGESFLEEPAARGSGQTLGGGGLGVMGFLWIGFTVGWETLAGTRWKVGCIGFLVGRAGFVKKGGAVFWVGRGLLTGAIEGERTEGLVG